MQASLTSSKSQPASYVSSTKLWTSKLPHFWTAQEKIAPHIRSPTQKRRHSCQSNSSQMTQACCLTSCTSATSSECTESSSHNSRASPSWTVTSTIRALGSSLRVPAPSPRAGKRHSTSTTSQDLRTRKTRNWEMTHTSPLRAQIRDIAYIQVRCRSLIGSERGAESTFRSSYCSIMSWRYHLICLLQCLKVRQICRWASQAASKKAKIKQRSHQW